MLNHFPAKMRLADFILTNTKSILAEWDAFARSIWPGSDASPKDVRDHAEAILLATAHDMKTAQTSREQSDKSKGKRDSREDLSGLDGASSDHAAGRAASGFDLRSLMAEYRALRASVVRLWLASSPAPDANDVMDLTRFHESMDQSLAAAVQRYSAQVETSRQMFLRVLGHDLRNPINAIAISAQAIAEMREDDPETAEIAEQMRSSTRAGNRMLNDFLDFAVTRLGRAIPVSPTPMDLGALCREVAAEVRTGAPQCRIQVEAAEALEGVWDRARLRQLLSNLLNNAVQHGDPGAGITVSAASANGRVMLRVHNRGKPIPAETLPRVFEPFMRGSNRGERGGSVGLGLYIAREVALAHGGSIQVASTASGGTTFTVNLPLRSEPVLDDAMQVEDGMAASETGR